MRPWFLILYIIILYILPNIKILNHLTKLNFASRTALIQKYQRYTCHGSTVSLGLNYWLRKKFLSLDQDHQACNAKLLPLNIERILEAEPQIHSNLNRTQTKCFAQKIVVLRTKTHLRICPVKTILTLFTQPPQEHQAGSAHPTSACPIHPARGRGSGLRSLMVFSGP